MPTISLSFIGKDSVPFKRDIDVQQNVYDAYKALTENKNPKDKIFDKVDSSDVSAFLNKVYKGISPKVLRTAKCNDVLIKNLKALKADKSMDDVEKLRIIYKANLEIARTLNHQKNISKNYSEQEEKAKARVTSSYDRLKELKKAQTAKLNKIDEQREKIKSMYSKMPNKMMKDKLAELDAKKEKLTIQLEKQNARIEKAKFSLNKKEETKDINLGTSLAAYADPRVIFSWAKDVNLPVEKIYTKALLEKFNWAKDTPADFWKK